MEAADEHLGADGDSGRAARRARRDLYVEHIGKVARGKSIQLILKELSEHSKELGANIVAQGAFIPFVESSRCLQLVEDVQADQIADQVITAAPAPWLAMLRKATENLPFAVIASDMFEPGAKLVSVNAAFEQLTGYERRGPWPQLPLLTGRGDGAGCCPAAG